MIRRPPRSTLSSSSAASDVYKRQVPEDTVDFKEGIFSSTATNKTLTFPEVALQAYIAHKFTGAQLEPGLKEGAFFDPTNFTFPSGVHICELEIDPETGATRIDRWT